MVDDSSTHRAVHDPYSFKGNVPVHESTQDAFNNTGLPGYAGLSPNSVPVRRVTIGQAVRLRQQQQQQQPQNLYFPPPSPSEMPTTTTTTTTSPQLCSFERDAMIGMSLTSPSSWLYQSSNEAAVGSAQAHGLVAQLQSMLVSAPEASQMAGPSSSSSSSVTTIAQECVITRISSCSSSAMMSASSFCPSVCCSSTASKEDYNNEPISQSSSQVSAVALVLAPVAESYDTPPVPLAFPTQPELTPTAEVHSPMMPGFGASASVAPFVPIAIPSTPETPMGNLGSPEQSPNLRIGDQAMSTLSRDLIPPQVMLLPTPKGFTKQQKQQWRQRVVALALCDHHEAWRRLRTRRRVDQMFCAICEAKWRVPHKPDEPLSALSSPQGREHHPHGDGEDDTDDEEEEEDK